MRRRATSSGALSGILRCGHCGTKMLAQYPGPSVIRYACAGRCRDPEATCCVMFGGFRADRLVAEQVLDAIKPLGIEAALQAIDSLQGYEDERIRQKELALQQAHYEVVRAQQQYDSVDPLYRLVAAELERRWNEALKIRAQIEEKLVMPRREQRGPLSEATGALDVGARHASIVGLSRQPTRVQKAYCSHAIKRNCCDFPRRCDLPGAALARWRSHRGDIRERTHGEASICHGRRHDRVDSLVSADPAGLYDRLNLESAADVRALFPRGGATFVLPGSGRMQPTATPAAPATTSTVILRTTALPN
jgi:hypothetical protein